MYEQIVAYRSAMTQARRMLDQGLVNEDEYVRIDTIMLEKYGLSSCSSFRDIHLITVGLRGNMSHDKEVK